MFRHYCVILSEFVVSTLPSYKGMSNAVIGSKICSLKLFYMGCMLFQKHKTYVNFKLYYIIYKIVLYIKFKIILRSLNKGRPT